MKTKLLMVFSAVGLLMQVSCVERYWPDLGGAYQNALVVDGMITDQPGPYTVKLSRSSSVDAHEWLAYPGCEMILICDDGASETLIEQSPGVYLSKPEGIRGEVGKRYKIRINTPEDQTYESTFELLKTAVELADVYTEEEIQPSETLNHSLEGLRFFVDTKPAVNDTNYLLWRMESTYKFQSSYLIRYTYDERRLQPFPKPDTFYYCWKTQEVPELFTYETTQLSEPVLKHFPLHYVSTQSRELSIRYSLLVHQLTITAEAYSYWNSLREQNENQDNLYNKQPYQILGNIKNINSPDEAVMGYFLVAGLSEKRIFVNRPIIPFYYWECVLSAPDYERMRDLRWSVPSEWPIYITADDDFRLAYPDQDCLVCTRKDGKLEEPDFWVE